MRIELKLAEIQECSKNFNKFEQFLRDIESRLDNVSFTTAS